MKIVGNKNKLLANINKIIMELKDDKDYILEIKQKTKKRSVNQNDLFYAYQNELAKKLRTSNEELHFELLKRYSPMSYVTLREEDNPSDYLDYFEEVKREEVKGKTFIAYRVYKPSRKMNTVEMTRLVEGLFSECNDVGIDTEEGGYYE